MYITYAKNGTGENKNNKNLIRLYLIKVILNRRKATVNLINNPSDNLYLFDETHYVGQEY